MELSDHIFNYKHNTDQEMETVKQSTFQAHTPGTYFLHQDIISWKFYYHLNQWLLNMGHSPLGLMTYS